MENPRFETTFYPLGFPLIVSSNSALVLEAAEREWSVWTPRFEDPPIFLRFEVSEGSGPRPPASVFRTWRQLFTVTADRENLAAGDTRGGTAAAWLTSPAVEDRAYFQYHFLDALAYHLITSLSLTPIHAACVARQGRGTLLCGDSHAGKSSLAYACARRGWTYVSDDASYLLRRRAAERIILGQPHHVRLRPEAARLFPELGGYTPAVRGNGKLALEIPTRLLGNFAIAEEIVAERIVLLRRNSQGDARLSPVDRSAARAICEPQFYWWDERVAAEQQAAFDTLLEGSEVFALEYSDVEKAIDLLEH